MTCHLHHYQIRVWLLLGKGNSIKALDWASWLQQAHNRSKRKLSMAFKSSLVRALPGQQTFRESRDFYHYSILVISGKGVTANAVIALLVRLWHLLLMNAMLSQSESFLRRGDNCKQCDDWLTAAVLLWIPCDATVWMHWLRMERS